MTTAPAGTGRALDALRHHARLVRQVVGLNVGGVTHRESLAHPRPGGNSLNWVLGHLVWTYEGALPLMGGEPVLPKGAVERYARGGAPLAEGEAPMDFEALRAVWDRAAERVDTGLASLDPDALDRPAPFSPSGDPNETVGSLLATVFFHQAYHAGQAGVLRRVAGKEGAIR
jgi:uncharacterized damage-inducible protein DinB